MTMAATDVLTGTRVADDAETPSDSVTGRDFRWFWGSHTISTFGDQVSMVAMPLAVYGRTGSAMAVGVAAAMEGLTVLIFAVLAGVLADRLDHRPVLLATDIARFGLLGGAAVMVATWSSYPVAILFAVAFAMGALRVLHDAARGAALPRVVRSTDLLRANGHISGSESAGNTIGPALAGGLMAAGGAGLAFAADAASFAGSAIGVGRVRSLRQRHRVDSSGPLTVQVVKADVAEGVGMLLRDGAFMRATALMAAMNLVAVAVEAQFIPYARQLLHLSGAAIGGYFAIGGVAGVAAAVFVSRREAARGDVKILGVSIFAAGVLLAGVAPSRVTAAIAYVCAGAGSALAISHYAAIRQRRFPVRLLGRVSMASRVFLLGTLPIGYLAGGWISRTAGPDMLYVVCGAVGLATALWATLTGLPRLRVIDLTVDAE
jgi:MFS family permease